MKVSDEQYQAAKLKDSRAKKISVDIFSDVVEIVSRPATRSEWKAYKALANDNDQNRSATANEQLVIFTTLHPTGGELTSLLDRYPASADVLAGKVKELSGLSSKVEVQD